MRRPFAAPPAARPVQAGASPGVHRLPSGLAACADLIGRLRLHAALPAPVFEARFIAPLERVARGRPQAHEGVAPPPVPGPSCDLRLCIETAFHSFQAADGRIFTGRGGVQARHSLEARWRYLCFATGLLHFPRITAQQGCDTGPQLLGPGNLEWLDAAGPRLSVLLAGPPHAVPGDTAPNGSISVCRELSDGHAQVARLVDDIAQGLRTRGGAAATAGPVIDSAAVPGTRAREPQPGIPQPLATDPPGLPPELRARIRDPLQAQRLVELVAVCRGFSPVGQAGVHPGVARHPEGLALALDFLVPVVRDLPRWSEAMAQAGLIHCPADRPGRRLVSWAFAPGGEPRPALILSQLACRRLGL